MEFLGFGIGGLGFLLFLIGWIWMIVIGFKTETLWGVINIFFQPITGLVFCIMHKTGWLQLALMILGWIIAVGGFTGGALLSQ